MSPKSGTKHGQASIHNLKAHIEKHGWPQALNYVIAYDYNDRVINNFLSNSFRRYIKLENDYDTLIDLIEIRTYDGREED